jgi:hypothetical protein
MRKDKVVGVLAGFGRKRLIAGLLTLGLGAVGVVLPPEVLTGVVSAVDLAVSAD